MIEFIETYLVPLLVMITGGYFLIKTRCFFIFDPKRFIRGLKYKNGEGDTSPVKAMTLALAGTLGVGNIVGIGGAIALGGAGALFWMWVSCIFAMIIKYAEVTVALHNKNGRNDRRGGPMYYIKTPLFAFIFTILCLICSLTLGGAIQCEAVYGSMLSTWNIPPFVSSVIISAAVLPVILMGKQKIVDITSKIVPIMSGVYAFMCIMVIIISKNRLPEVFSLIFKSAFDFPAVMAGGGWAAVRYGVLRGLISNEAGCGTAPIAHSSTKTDCPSAQGCFGILEVFFDTAVLCSLTGLSILLVQPEGEGILGIINCFSPVFGDLSGILISVSVFFFAFATMICWFYYGEECILFIYGKGAVKPFAFVFCIFTALTPLFPSNTLWQITDLAVALMTVINLFALIKYRNIPVDQLRRL